jgi:hypothetical protein
MTALTPAAAAVAADAAAVITAAAVAVKPHLLSHRTLQLSHLTS